MGAIKRLNATPMLSTEIIKQVPVTALERYILLRAIAGSPPASFDETRKRKDVFDALCADDWSWDSMSTQGIKPEEYEKEHEIRMTKAVIQNSLEMIKVAMTGKEPGRFAFALLDLYDRLSFVLTGDGG